MESLNDIIKNHVRIRSRTFQAKDLEVEFDLDSNMPKIYPDFMSREGTPNHLSELLLELTGEQCDAKIFDEGLTKLRYSTLYVDDTQVIIIEHNGKPIPNETLSKLNEELDQIRIGEYRQGRLTGNVRAAVQAYVGGGGISYENHPTWEYKVDATIQLPVKAPSTPC